MPILRPQKPLIKLYEISIVSQNNGFLRLFSTKKFPQFVPYQYQQYRYWWYCNIPIRVVQSFTDLFSRKNPIYSKFYFLFQSLNLGLNAKCGGKNLLPGQLLCFNEWTTEVVRFHVCARVINVLSQRCRVGSGRIDFRLVSDCRRRKASSFIAACFFLRSCAVK